MPTLNWLKKEFNYGYDSGNVLSIVPNLTRFKEEKAIGGSYRNVFSKAVLPYIKSNSIVLELGPGRGSWSRALLKYLPHGELHTIDFQNAEKWLEPNKYNNRLTCNKVEDNSLSCLKDNYFDFFWSFGVLCHNNIESIKEILRNSLLKMKPGGIAVHQYGDWDKLDTYGWKKGKVPVEFKDQLDDKIWWPRNNQKVMSSLATQAGWSVLSPDLGLVKRDSIIVLQRE